MTNKTVKTYISGRYEGGHADTSSQITSRAEINVGKSRIYINMAQIGVEPRSYLSTNRRLQGDVLRHSESGSQDTNDRTD